MIRAAIIGATPGEIAAAIASLCAVITALWAVYRTKDNKHDKSQEDAIASLRKDLKAVSDARDAAWKEVGLMRSMPNACATSSTSPNKMHLFLSSGRCCATSSIACTTRISK